MSFTKHDVDALLHLKGCPGYENFSGAKLIACAEFLVKRGLIEGPPYQLTPSGYNFAFHVNKSNTKEFCKRPLLSTNWIDTWKSEEECRRLMQLNLHWSAIALEICGSSNCRSTLRAKFDPNFRERFKAQQRAHEAKRTQKCVQIEDRQTTITLPRVRCLENESDKGTNS